MKDVGIQPNKWNVATGVFLFAALVLIDLLTKQHAEEKYLNQNFAFSIKIPDFLMYLIYFATLSLILRYVAKNILRWRVQDFFPWVLILSGAMSNVAERLVLGHVRDWIYIYNGIFNLADFYIILGALILLSGRTGKV